MEKGNGNGRLTGLQQAFVVEYCKDFNATRAAQRAGYRANGDPSFAVIGSENLRKVKIRDAISGRLGEQAMGKEELAHRLAMIARSSVEDVLRFDGKGGWVVDIPKAQDEGLLYGVSKIENTQYGLRVAMESKLRALEILAKAHGMLIDRQEQSGEVRLKVVYDDDGIDDQAQEHAEAPKAAGLHTQQGEAEGDPGGSPRGENNGRGDPGADGVS